MGSVHLEISSLTKAGASPSFLTAYEDALLDSSDLLAWFDARAWSGEKSSAGRIRNWYSRKAIGVAHPKLSAVSEALGAYWGIVPGGTEREEIRVGLDAAGSVISGFNNKLLTGSSLFTLPATDFTIDTMLRCQVASGATVILGTSDTTDPFVVTITNTGIIRVYRSYSGGTELVATNAAAWANDTSHHRLRIRHDATAHTTEIAVDGSVVKAMTAQNLSSHAGQTLNLGTITDGGSTSIAGSGFALQGLLMIGAIDGVTSALYTPVLAERAA